MSFLDQVVAHDDLQKTISNMNRVFMNLPVDVQTDEGKEKLRSQVYNIRNEIEELQDAFKITHKKVSIKETLDAFCDIITFALGATHLLGEKYNPIIINTFSHKKILDSLWDQYDKTEELVNADDINVPELVNALSLIVNTTIACSDVYGFDTNGAMREVTRSNLTKLCFNRKDTEDTVKKYNDKGIEVFVVQSEMFGVPYEVVYTVRDRIQYDDEGKEYQAGKFLKNANKFEEPNLLDFI